MRYKIKPIGSKASHAHMAATDKYGKDAFRYDEAAGGYKCPEGHLIKPWAMKMTSKSKGSVRNGNYDACTGCKVRLKCTSGKKERTIHDRPFHEYAKEVDKRTKENMEMYNQRKQLVEHPFGTVKRAFGFSYFLTRGAESVRAESLLHFFVHNLKRAINLAGTKETIGVLNG